MPAHTPKRRRSEIYGAVRLYLEDLKDLEVILSRLPERSSDSWRTDDPLVEWSTDRWKASTLDELLEGAKEFTTPTEFEVSYHGDSFHVLRLHLDGRWAFLSIDDENDPPLSGAFTAIERVIRRSPGQPWRWLTSTRGVASTFGILLLIVVTAGVVAGREAFLNSMGLGLLPMLAQLRARAFGARVVLERRSEHPGWLARNKDGLSVGIIVGVVVTLAGAWLAGKLT